MPSIRKKTNRAGDAVYEIRVSRGRGKSYLTRRWQPPEGWSQKAIDRELARVAAEFERQCHAGEVLSRSEMAAIEAQRAAEDAKEIESYLELLYQKSTKTDESSEWKLWPGTTPPDDESCLVTFLDNGHVRTLVGKYHEEFSLWVFPTLDGRVQTFTVNDKNISELNWRPL